MKIPKLYDEGLSALINTTSKERIALVKIASSTIPDNKNTFFQKIISDLEVPHIRIFGYAPPKSCSHHSRYREEIVPTITDVNLSYVIIDDMIETGKTLRCAVERLENQGVNRNNIWFSVGGIIEFIPGPKTGYLDRVSLLF